MPQLAQHRIIAFRGTFPGNFFSEQHRQLLVSYPVVVAQYNLAALLQACLPERWRGPGRMLEAQLQ